MIVSCFPILRCFCVGNQARHPTCKSHISWQPAPAKKGEPRLHYAVGKMKLGHAEIEPQSSEITLK
jgi:hypothetical protein